MTSRRSGAATHAGSVEEGFVSFAVPGFEGGDFCHGVVDFECDAYAVNYLLFSRRAHAAFSLSTPRGRGG